MITQDKQCQYSDFANLDQQLEIISEDQPGEQYIEELSNSPILETYLCNQYQLLNQKNIALSNLCHIRIKDHLQQKINQIRAYFKRQQIINAQKIHQTKKRKQISSQFSLNFHNIPAYSIVYVSIYQIQSNRFNMLVRNPKGQCLAYHWKQRKCKKLPKILKMFKKFKKTVLAVISDNTTSPTISVYQINKISEAVSHFMYIFQNAQNVNVNNEVNDLRSESFLKKQLFDNFQYIGNRLLISSSYFSDLSEMDIIEYFIDPIKRIQSQQLSALEYVRGEFNESKRNLELDFIFINIWKTWDCLPQQVITIIERLYIKQQKQFSSGEQIQQQNQRESEQNQNPNSHFPNKMSKSKQCKRCENLYKKKMKKTNFRCEGCSITFKKDIPLCPECFGDFHQRIKFFTSKIGLYKQSEKQLSDKLQKQKQSQVSFQQQLSQPYSQKDDSKKIYNQKAQDIGKLIKEIQFSPETGEKIKKLDKCLTETFKLTKDLAQQKKHEVLYLFLSYTSGISIQMMEKIGSKYQSLNTNHTKISDLITKNWQKQMLVKQEMQDDRVVQQQKQIRKQ